MTRQAAKAIREAPNPIDSPADCKGLKGIGPVISKYLKEQYALGIEGGTVLANFAQLRGATTVASRQEATPRFPDSLDIVEAFLMPIGKSFSDSYSRAFREQVRSWPICNWLIPCSEIRYFWKLQGYDNFLVLSTLSEADIVDLGVDMPIGHRKAILKRTEQIAADPAGPRRYFLFLEIMA